MACSPKEIEEQFKADYKKVCDTFEIPIGEREICYDKAYELHLKYLKHSVEPYEVNLKRR